MNPYEFVLVLVAIVGGCITCWVYMATNQQSSKAGKNRPPEPGARYSVSELSAMAESLQERIDTLESILDAEVPDWRDQNERATEPSSNQPR